MTTGRNPRVYVADSPIHGRGLFAARPLTAGEWIGQYQGPRVTENGDHVLWIEDEDGEGWTGYDGRNEMRFLNHSRRPNAEMDGLECYSLENIDRGEEITIDYGWDES